MPFRGRRVIARRPRERYEWTFAGFGTPRVVAVGANDTPSLLTVAALEEFPRSKLVKIIGSIFVSPATAPAGASGYIVGLGLTKAQVGAASSTYDALANLDHRWTWWQCCFPQIGGSGAADQNAARWAGYFRFDLMYKTAERFADDEQFIISVSNSSASAASIQYSCL